MTATLEQARADARRQEADTGPRPGNEGAGSIWEETVAGGNYGTHRVPRGGLIEFVAVAGDTTAAVVVHRAEQPVERLNIADTVKVQWQAYPTTGTVLLSDMGRVLLTIVADGCPPRSHDALCGGTNEVSEPRRTGEPTGAWSGHPSARDLLLLGLAKHGLSRRDLPPSLNLFGGASVAEDGTLEMSPPVAAGASITLRAELDVLVTFAVVRHPLDGRGGASAGPVGVRAWCDEQAFAHDVRSSTPERRRAFENAAELLASGGR